MYAMGRSLKAGVEKKLAIPFAPRLRQEWANPRLHSRNGAQILDRRAHAIDRKLVRRRVVHDAALADLFPARFELRLDQNDRLDADSLQRVPVVPLPRRATAGSTRVAEIKDTSMDTKLMPGTQFTRFEVAGIGALAQAHPRIPGAGLRQSARIRYPQRSTPAAPCCSMQSVKPPVDVPMSAHCRPLRSICQRVKSGLQLESAAADVALLFPQHPQQRSCRRREAPGFSTFCWLTNTRPARISACARSAGRRQPALEQQLIQANSHRNGGGNTLLYLAVSRVL